MRPPAGTTRTSRRAGRRGRTRTPPSTRHRRPPATRSRARNSIEPCAWPPSHRPGRRSHIRPETHSLRSRLGRTAEDAKPGARPGVLPWRRVRPDRGAGTRRQYDMGVQERAAIDTLNRLTATSDEHSPSGSLEITVYQQIIAVFTTGKERGDARQGRLPRAGHRHRAQRHRRHPRQTETPVQTPATDRNRTGLFALPTPPAGARGGKDRAFRGSLDAPPAAA